MVVGEPPTATVDTILYEELNRILVLLSTQTLGASVGLRQIAERDNPSVLAIDHFVTRFALRPDRHLWTLQRVWGRLAKIDRPLTLFESGSHRQ